MAQLGPRRAGHDRKSAIVGAGSTIVRNVAADALAI